MATLRELGYEQCTHPLGVSVSKNVTCQLCGAERGQGLLGWIGGSLDFEIPTIAAVATSGDVQQAVRELLGPSPRRFE